MKEKEKSFMSGHSTIPIPPSSGVVGVSTSHQTSYPNPNLKTETFCRFFISALLTFLCLQDFVKSSSPLASVAMK